MQINVRAKQAGKKRALIENQTLEIRDIGASPTLKILLAAIVEQFNQKSVEANLLAFLSKNEIDSQAEQGKVGFGSRYNSTAADAASAQATALQAFEDGLFAVFVGDDEIKNLDTVIDLNEISVITFVLF